VSNARGCHLCPLVADVAQLVEQRFRKPQVTGSNPVVGSIHLGSRKTLTAVVETVRSIRWPSTLCGFGWLLL
jgi:hypothetical protein